MVSCEVKDKQWDLDELMSIIEGEIEARERAAVTSANLYKTPVRVTLPTASALMAGSGASGVSCCFCCQSHTSASCSIVTDVAEQKLLLRQSGRCFVCLKKYHMSRDCRSRLRCNNCNGRHHVSICPETPQPANRTTKAPGQNNHDRPENVPTLQPVSTTGRVASNCTSQDTSLYCENSKMPVLLQTAKAKVFRPDDPQRTTNVRLIFGTIRSSTQIIMYYNSIEPCYHSYLASRCIQCG